tara:strand:- start:1051 stop:2304 length:1254 start_codon:yes stop_codon:yes gene_type:complete
MNRKFMSLFVTSLIGGTALTTAAIAQTSQEFGNNEQYCLALEAINTEEYDRLNPEWITESGPVVAAGDEEQCRVYYEDASSALAGSDEGISGSDEGISRGGQIIVTQPDPSVSVQQDAPEVTVSQPEPDVSVTQPRPEIIVRQVQPTITVQMPRPIITIDQPQPEIIVRMPDPQVNVATPEPEIEVNQDAPQVSVEQAQPEVNVQLPEPDVNVDDSSDADVTVDQGQAIVRQQQSEGGANVDIQQSQPLVSYESAEPNVVFEEQADPEIRFTESGEPNVRFEDAETAPGAAPDASADATDPNASLRQGDEVIDAGDPLPYLASDMIGQQIVNAQGEELGTVDRLVTTGSRNYVILAEGGFLGMGEREVALPLDSMSVSEGRLLMRGMTDEDIEAMPEFDSAGAQEIDGGQTVEIATP